MSGMEGLGRVFNIVPISTAGPAIRLKNDSAISFVTTGAAAVATLTIATTFGATYRTTGYFTTAWVPITRVYYNTQTDGTGVWSKATITAAAVFTHGGSGTAGLTTAAATVFTVFGSQLPDTYAYIKCTVTGSGIGAAILHDLTVQRKPENLSALSIA